MASMREPKSTQDTFIGLVAKFTPPLMQDTADALVQGYAAGEQRIVFEALLDNLTELSISVDAQTRDELRSIAEALGCLDYESGKGRFW